MDQELIFYVQYESWILYLPRSKWIYLSRLSLEAKLMIKKIWFQIIYWQSQIIEMVQNSNF